MAERTSPVRTCVGCRARAAKADLLRVVLVEIDGVASVAPDPRSRLPGRGASLHPVAECLDLAERRRAFPRALRWQGPVDTGPLRRWLAEQAGPAAPPAPPHASEEAQQASTADKHSPPAESRSRPR